MGGAMGESDKTPRRSAKKARCAIYTRKSSEEGLEQAFNSLDAQREACAAFILSQKHEGWTVLPALYDDGGFSGGTMERPALKRLIADIEAGQIDVVVVYKVDRLTRALSDFAKLVEVFDRRGVSFVSITQQFNTTTSMGRLTLNVLLSFAQFEREVTGERIRDKVAASKKKGMWMGGMPPLGYDVKNRKLVVNDAEARIVVEIYRRYLALKSVHALRDELAGHKLTLREARRHRVLVPMVGVYTPGWQALPACSWEFVELVTREGPVGTGEWSLQLDQPAIDALQRLADNPDKNLLDDDLEIPLFMAWWDLAGQVLGKPLHRLWAVLSAGGSGGSASPGQKPAEQPPGQPGRLAPALSRCAARCQGSRPGRKYP